MVSGQRRVNQLIADAGLATFATFDTGRKLISVRGELKKYSGTIPKLGPLELIELHGALRQVERMRKKVSPSTPWKHRDARRLDGISVEAAIGDSLQRPGSRASFDAAVRTVFGAEAAELSMLQFLSYVNGGGGLMNLVSVSGGAQQDRIVGGAQRLATELAKGLDDVQLSVPVSSVRHEEAGLRVEHAKGELTARHLIVAIPPNLVDRIAFEPALPADKRHALRRSPMGSTIKVLVTYERAFWRERGLSGEAVSDAPPFAVVFDNSDREAQPALLGFVVGQPARDFALLPEARRRSVAIAELCRMFGPDAASVVDYIEHDWSQEEWTGGCPVASPQPGVLSLNGGALRSRAGRISFAGTEFAREYCGYMEGALEAAERAATEALLALAAR